MLALRIVSIVVIVAGVVCYAVGVMFKIMHWPDLFKGTISGPVIFCLGIILLILSFILRKKSSSE